VNSGEYVQSTQNQVCAPGCPYNTQVYPSWSPNICRPCGIPDCDDCDPSGLFCNTCYINDASNQPHNPPKLLSYPASTARCVDSCEEGQYNDATHCIPCTENNCKTCTATECQACFYPYLLHSVDKNCITACPDGMYLDVASQTCFPCMAGCDICSNGVTCDQCASPKYVDTNTRLCVDCITQNSQIAIGYECHSCHSSCLECDGIEESSCTVCQPGLTLTVTRRCVTPNSTPI
jgi:hypothetical protein